MTMPGFTAEASLYKMRAHYREVTGTLDAMAAADLSLALPVIESPTPDVDCGTIPDSITCIECGSTGPGTFSCCKLQGKAPENCVIKPYDPPPLGRPPLTWWLPKWPGVMALA
jgi:hypothetical protein